MARSFDRLTPSELLLELFLTLDLASSLQISKSKIQEGVIGMTRFAVLLIAIFSSTIVNAQDELPRAIPLKIIKAYIPAGFDNNDRVQVVVEGILPSTCYKVGPYKVDFDVRKMELKILQSAYKYKGPCMEMPVPFQNILNIGISPLGDFLVRDGRDDSSLGRLPIAMAKTVRADDYLYAPVSEVTIDSRWRRVTISGSFSNNCMVLREIRMIRESHNVVTALPISEALTGTGVECKNGIFPFTKTVNLPMLNEARYLLHVRSLDGQATNKLFTLGEQYPVHQ